MLTTEPISDEEKRWAMREYFRHSILARYNGDQRAAWAHLVTAVVRGRRMVRSGVPYTAPYAASPDECHTLLREVMAGTARFL